MSYRGGRGGGRIFRPVAATTTHLDEPPPLYPILARRVLPLEGNEEHLQFMADLKQEIYEGFRNSEYFMDKEDKTKVQRYVDKYNKQEKGKFRPDFSRIPAELCYIQETGKSKSKRRKLDESGLMKDELNKLEDNDAEGEEEDDGARSSDSEKSTHTSDGDPDSERSVESDDYNDAYFSNGEGYGSDDNLGDDD